MLFSDSVLALVAINCPFAQAKNDVLEARESRPKEEPDADDFIRRVDTAVTVHDDYLYILGGHFARDVDGDPKVEAPNATLSISLKDDWTSEDVDINSFASDAGPQAIWGHGFWTDSKNDQLLVWGGSDVPSDDTGAKERKLWRLSPDNKGGGAWESEDVKSEIKRTARGGYASCGGVGYLMGGRGNSETDNSAFGEDFIMVPGLITYDFDSKDWKNESTTDVTAKGGWARGRAMCVEMPNRSPKLLLLGGTPSVNEADAFSFVNVHYWDPDQNKWFKQETAGTRPANRVDTCTVGVPGPNGTYEIFMYSGWQGSFQNGKVLQDVWVLSIPAFRWFRGSLDKVQGRHAHQCVRVGSQMIVVGGGSRRDWWKEEDTFDRGIGIMDLNSISWKNGFKAQSDEYQSPQPVREWYEKYGYDKTIWENDDVEKAFGYQGNSGSEPSPSPSSDSGSSSTPAIIGGVVGGVAGLAVVGLAAWFVMRRRRRQRQADDSSPQAMAQHDAYDPSKPVEADGTPSTYLSRTPQPPQELDSREPQELDATRNQKPAELPG